MEETMKAYVLFVKCEADDSYYPDYLYAASVHSTYEKAATAGLMIEKTVREEGKVRVGIHEISAYSYHGFEIYEFDYE